MEQLLGAPPPRRRRRLLPALVTVVLAAGAVAVWAAYPGDEPATGTPAPTGTAEVTERDLAVTEDVDGDLGYDDQRELGAHRAGVVTALAAAGHTVKRGGTLYAIDTEPAVLLAGSVPAYRKLDPSSSDGPDVKQLEQGLAALGYGAGLTVNDDFSSATADAVEKWERDLGRDDPDGTVDLGDVVFAPGGTVRVTARPVGVGAQVQATTSVLEVSSTTKVANVDLVVGKADLVAPGDTVSVSLPDGSATPGRVASVGSDLQTNEQDPDADPTVAMVVTLTRPADAAQFDTGAVTVTLTSSTEPDALSVPVTALLALTEGGYAVQVPDAAQPGGYRLLAVVPGTITDDYAAISGAGLRAGLTVVVPK